MFTGKKNKDRFLYKKSYIKRRLQYDVMENGTAYIPCMVDGIDDIISSYSIKGHETLDDRFMNYVLEYVDYIPAEYPAVLNIHGPEFTEDEKKIITDCVTADMDYMLGKTDEKLRRKRRRFFGMIAGTVISWAALYFAKMYIPDIPLEMFYVIFWLFADALVRYLFIEKLDFRDERIRVGRLASMRVEFEEDTSKETDQTDTDDNSEFDNEE